MDCHREHNLVDNLSKNNDINSERVVLTPQIRAKAHKQWHHIHCLQQGQYSLHVESAILHLKVWPFILERFDRLLDDLIGLEHHAETNETHHYPQR